MTIMFLADRDHQRRDPFMRRAEVLSLGIARPWRHKICHKFRESCYLALQSRVFSLSRVLLMQSYKRDICSLANVELSS